MNTPAMPVSVSRGSLIEARGVHKAFGQTPALRGANVTVRQGGDVGVPAVAQREPGPAAQALTAVAYAVAAHVSVRAAAAEGQQPALSIS